MDIADIRRENIRKYIKDNFRTRAEFAEKINKSPAQVAMWFMKSQGRRDIGEKLARDIETALELPSGWMDRQTLSTTHATRYETTTPVSASHATGYEGENLPSDEELASLISVSTETYRGKLEQIQSLKDTGVLEQSDQAILENIESLLNIIRERYKDRLK